ncbi:hypothetical protein BT93_F3193 [Corymbia citriodora subsp. variegata]|nr:hypothetical protein BT93_F3193 [Corymbia citriodora subsp. variegata]
MSKGCLTLCATFSFLKINVFSFLLFCERRYSIATFDMQTFLKRIAAFDTTCNLTASFRRPPPPGHTLSLSLSLPHCSTSFLFSSSLSPFFFFFCFLFFIGHHKDHHFENEAKKGQLHIYIFPSRRVKHQTFESLRVASDGRSPLHIPALPLRGSARLHALLLSLLGSRHSPLLQVLL